MEGIQNKSRFHDYIELIWIPCLFILCQTMLTRREKLLVRPWQLRRYNNHRKKVLTALPVIDFGPPAQRGHVALKLKKMQKETERRMKIEEDNFRLLQRMGTIMRENRLDNHWEKKQPNFLGRVGIYHRTRSPTPCNEATPSCSPDSCVARKSRCIACAAQQKKVASLPENGSENPKKTHNKGLSASTTLIITTSNEATTNWEINRSLSRNDHRPNFCKSPMASHEFRNLPAIHKNLGKNLTASGLEKGIVLEQGSLHLAVNLPVCVDVKIKTAKEKCKHNSPKNGSK